MTLGSLARGSFCAAVAVVALAVGACSPSAPIGGGAAGGGRTGSGGTPASASGGSSGNPGPSGSGGTTTGANSGSTGGTTGTGGSAPGTGGSASQPPPGDASAPDTGGESDTAPGPVSGPIGDPGSAGDGERTIGPNYTADPLTMAQAGAPKGRLVRFTMRGADSQIYKGINGNYTRNVTVYVPMQYVPNTPAPFMVTQDALGAGVMPTVLDNLINAKKMPRLVVLFVGNGGGDYIGSERGLEYDTVSGLFAEYINTEVLPRAIMEVKTQASIDLKFTTDPEGRGTMGGSSGGAASFSMAWWRPDLFRRVLTYSGTYVTQVPAGSPFPHGCWIYHDVDPYNAATVNGLIVQHCEPMGGFKGSAKVGPCDTPLSKTACEAVTGCAWNTKVNRPLRIWLQSSDRDLGAGGSPTGYRNFDLANQRMAAALKARGYHYHYDHSLNAGHVDSKVTNQTLPEALLWLWRGYPID